MARLSMRTRQGFWSRLLIAAVLASSVPGFASAKECGPLKQTAAVDLTPLPNGLRMVPVTINGMPRNLLLATAGGISLLSQSAVQEFGLHPLNTGNVRLLTRNGYAADTFVDVKHFELGRVQGSDVRFLVSPDARMGSNPQVPIAGVLANDLMSQFDAEMDFQANKLKYFSTDHCDGNVVYWDADVIAIVPYSSLRPGSSRPDTQLRIHVKIDGHDLQALINTGEVRSTVTAEIARDVLHITSDSEGAIPRGTIANDPDQKVFSYVFKSLAFEGVSVARPEIFVIPNLVGSKDPNNRYRTGGHIKRVDDDIAPEVTIGMDVLKKLHLYVATREHKLYITPAVAQPNPSP